VSDEVHKLFFIYCTLGFYLFIFVIQINLMYYLSLIYFVKQSVHVWSVLIAHQQEVFTGYVQQLVRVIHLGEWQLPVT
jgi:hypothetical protein